MSLANNEFLYNAYPYIDIEDLTHNESNVKIDEENHHMNMRMPILSQPADPLNLSVVNHVTSKDNKKSNNSKPELINTSKNSTPKRKRNRRTATEIQRLWNCNLCEKAYGTEGALKTHYKLKHPNNRIDNLKKDDMNTFQGIDSVYSSNFLNINNNNTSTQISNTKNLYLNTTDMLHHMPQSLNYKKLNLQYQEANSKDLDDHLRTVSKLNQEKSNYHHEFFSEDNIYVPISFLMIGDFVEENFSSNHLVALFSFSGRKIYWEKRYHDHILQMEISFDDIMDLIIEYKGETAIFHVYLYFPPRFWIGWILFNECKIIWKPIPDFTGGCASRYMYHILYFDKSLIWKPLEKLLIQESRIRGLVEKYFVQPNLYFQK